MANSLVVRMFTALARGEMAAQPPERIRKVVAVVEVFGLCLKCQAIGLKDEIHFEHGRTWKVCRCCRTVEENGYLTDARLMDNGWVISEVEHG